MMIYRPMYVDKIMAYTDTPFVKILTGVRRCGKSTILKMIMEKLKERGGNESLMDRYESGSSIHNGYCFQFYFIAIAKGRLRATLSACLLLYFRYKLISGS